ncbi:MAG TPA: DUF2191 domain-containing protein [Terriglobia bacterium]|nr:DUF2191 domain-containing protein [Terriglobia bacterium]
MSRLENSSQQLGAKARESGEPFKQIVNECLRIGLNVQTRAASTPPFKVKARALGSSGFNYDCVWELIEQAEGPFFRRF